MYESSLGLLFFQGLHYDDLSFFINFSLSLPTFHTFY